MGLILDTGALIGLERNDRRVTLLLDRAQRDNAELVVCAPVVAQALRSPQRQVALVRLLRRKRTTLRPFTGIDAWEVGQLLAASGTSDVVDAHVVVTARRLGLSVVTSDPSDLAQLDPSTRLIEI